MKKKADMMALDTVGYAVLALIIIVISVILIMQAAGKFSKSSSCSQKPGHSCTTEEECGRSNGAVNPALSCADKQVCCYTGES